jgi:tetrahydromethanopterin S-methyltransferase subunit G
MAEPDNLVLSLLHEMRGDMTNLRAEMATGFRAVEARLVALDDKVDSVKQAAFGESVLGRYAAAEVEERLAEIERRLQALETRS